ncbi:hypothetical protein BC629DRAFT_1285897 [Irpex lacteus]|nr:hypothetical protein BC629DRAFT_1285897 [Irpex lacteus]
MATPVKRQRAYSDADDDNGEPALKRVASVTDDTLGRLSRLLDLSSTTSPQGTLSRFSAIAKTLLHETRLQVTSALPHHGEASSNSTTSVNTEYELLEIEFYLWKADSHEDPFTHGSEEQRRSGRWYFHRAPTKATGASSSSGARSATAAGGYRGGTRKGLDLTFGSPSESSPAVVSSRYFQAPQSGTKPAQSEVKVLSSTSQDIRGGILLRTIRRISDEKVISGPSVLVDEILRASGASTIVELVNQKWAGDTTAWSLSTTENTSTLQSSLRLIPVTPTPEQLNPPHIYSSPRIGLDLSHSSIPLPSTPAGAAKTLGYPRLTFISREYRFFVHPELLTANGRGHTFLGVYRSLTSESEKERSKGGLKERLVALTGLKANTVDKYLQEYLESVKDGRLSAFVVAKGKGAGSNPVSALRMFGTLEHKERR